MTADTLAQQLERDGFVIVRQLVQGSDLEELRAAAARTAAKARAGDWPHVRTVGKQFPPWQQWNREAAAAAKAAAEKGETAAGGGIWGVQHLMQPDLGPDAAVFTRSYFAAGGVLDIAKRLLGPSCCDDDLVMELYNMLVRPDYSDYALRWHRDDIPPEASAADELARLVGQPAWHAQWNLALWDDASLVVVPGSHRRARTAGERAADPFADTLPDEPDEKAVPQLVARLGPGDAVFYDNNILHRGVYRTAVERATLHGSVGHVAGSRQRARNVLQHGLGAWVDRCDLSGLSAEERRRAEGMRDRLMRLGQDSGDVGYSQGGGLE